MDSEAVGIGGPVHQGVVVKHVVLDVVDALFAGGEVSHDKRAVMSTSNCPIRVAIKRDYGSVDSRVDLVIGLFKTVVLGTFVFHHKSGDSDNLFIIALESVSCKSLWVESGDKAGVVVTVSKVLVLEDGLTKAEVVGDTLDDVLVKSGVQKVHGSGSVFTPSDSLGDHGIVVDRNFRAFFNAGVDSHIRVSSGLLVLIKEADGRQELAGWVFSIDSVLNRVTVDLYIILLES